VTSAKFDPELYARRPWYHDFSALGYDTVFLDRPIPLREKAARVGRFFSSRLPGRRSSPLRQNRLGFADIYRRRPSSHVINQRTKEKDLIGLAESALGRLPPDASSLDLFCADGYYACRLKTIAPGARVTGVDLDERAVGRAEIIARKLGLEITFGCVDAREALRGDTAFDLLLCAGGLYHLEDPASLLHRARSACRGFALFQSVVTTTTEDDDYFEAPAPGLSHGSRFSDAWLGSRLREAGFEIEEHRRVELPGNLRPEDRGSSYFLCR
jgi:hypothetical protein